MTSSAPSRSPLAAPKPKKMPKAKPNLSQRLWRPRRLSMAPPVETVVDAPPKHIKGSVGRMLQKRKQVKGEEAEEDPGGTSSDLAADKLIKRTTAAKTKAKPEDIASTECAESTEGQQEEALPSSSSSRPELVLPVTLDGQLSHFTSAGTLRSGPHPHDPETTLWYLETTGAAPDIALTQMPVWVKQALERPPLSAAPSPPRSSRTTRKPRAPSPSTSI